MSVHLFLPKTAWPWEESDVSNSLLEDFKSQQNYTKYEI